MNIEQRIKDKYKIVHGLYKEFWELTEELSEKMAEIRIEEAQLREYQREREGC